MCFTINEKIKARPNRKIGFKVVEIGVAGRLTAKFADRYTPGNPAVYALGVENRLVGLTKGKDTARSFFRVIPESTRGFYIFLTKATALKHMRRHCALIKVSVKPKDFLHESTRGGGWSDHKQATYRAVTPIKILADSDTTGQITERA